ncbi:amidohydrolase family protein [Actinomycetospora sp. NBRC 106378]|uniref:amidohydrolase family protein n=1 Tax=Actinomycetospora sp. NBRC 106378 TaxID=3032208 RepID=UPI0024A339C8|nr:amidohydrolase family protein [Actinomycetospora sp. NBRC 106378]GLZ54320.1 hypothetical protein Acsp07_39370 [Actinomycetospora sp. NBRC 106378]
MSEVSAVLAGVVVPGDGGPPVHDAMILVEDGRIVSVGRRTERAVPEGAEVLDATDAWVVPGLTEGHAHVTSFASEAYHPHLEGRYRAAPLLMESFVRHGITTIRDTGGPDLGALNRLQTHGEAWPRLFGSGPNLDGHPGGPWKGMWKTDDPAEAVEFVAREADGGVDFIKVYAWMGEEVLAAVVRAAHRRGLRVAGHVGHRVTGRRAVELGVDALEHVRIGPELVPESDRAEFAALPHRPRDEMASTRAWRYVDVDGPLVEQVLTLLVEHGTWLTPTLTIFDTVLRRGRDHDHDHGHGAPDPDADLRAAMARHKDATSAMVERDPEDERLGLLEFERLLAFVGRAHEAGVPIVAGSDTPSASVLAGAGLHDELALLVEAGLSPFEALTAATGEPARLLGTPRRGVLRPGCPADLVVLDRDPLADVTATRAIRSVHLAGVAVHHSSTAMIEETV